MELYYVDTCIWLNLWKKEGSAEFGVPYYEIAANFIGSILSSDDKKIIYSGFIIKEIKFKLNDETLLKEKLSFLKEQSKIKFIKAITEDYCFARRLEASFNYKLSFYDCLHIAICKRLNAVLVTRDKDLIKHAGYYVSVGKPESLFP